MIPGFKLNQPPRRRVSVFVRRAGRDMFTIRLMPGIFPGYVAVTAKAPTLAQALAFVGEFSELQSLIIEAPWIERNGRYVMDVFDWCACWFSDPPVMAQVIAPSGFTPAAERL